MVKDKVGFGIFFKVSSLTELLLRVFLFSPSFLQWVQHPSFLYSYFPFLLFSCRDSNLGWFWDFDWRSEKNCVSKKGCLRSSAA